MGDTERDISGRPAVGRASFLLISGHGRLITHALDASERELVIGRDPDCDIVVDHARVSRRHVRLRLGPPVTIEDLDSTNGTRVARQTSRGGGPVVLERGETFQVGGFSFTIVDRDAARSAATRSSCERLEVHDPTPAGVPSFVHDVARSGASILIQGESGAGKEVLAATLHALSGRSGNLARVNCAALAEPLIESELFGHEKGAFTGASGTKVGLLESAQGGTVFLDEIGELSHAIQAKLLRAIESHEVVRIGSVRPIQIDARFIAATHRDLPQEVAARRFRQDLYFRLDGVTLRVPPLRERRGQIAPLAMQFLAAAALRAGRRDVRLSAEAVARLATHDWPGNVRELKAVVERALLLCRKDEVAVRHLVFSPRGDGSPTELPGADDPLVAGLTVEERAQRKQLVDALEATGGNQSRAAKALGISRTTVVNRIRLFRVSRLHR